MNRYKNKRFTRSRKPPAKRVAIQPRDLEIFQNLADYRFLDSSHLLALHPSGGGAGYHLRRLQHLFHLGFVDRPPSQLSYYRTRGKMIYALGGKGAAAIWDEKPELKRKIDWGQKNREVKFPFLDHALMVSDFRVALNLALRDSRQTKLATWKHGEDLKDYVFLRDAGGYRRKTPVVPDGFFTIEAGDYRSHFFLEADRSTMTTERFLRKIAAYWEWRKLKAHEKKHGIKGFRVLTLTLSPERRDNLLKASRELVNKNKKEGSGVFWFACSKDFNFANPKSVLDSIWLTTKDDAKHYLLEPARA